MRLWNYRLLDVLPRQQLLSQLRECVAIAKDIHEKGKTNHILINKIMDYPISHFQRYCDNLITEMESRNYNISQATKDKLSKYLHYQCDLHITGYQDAMIDSVMFGNWHTDRYLVQCLYNLEEKYDCGGITEKEWDKIYHKFYMYLDY